MRYKTIQFEVLNSSNGIRYLRIGIFADIEMEPGDVYVVEVVVRLLEMNDYDDVYMTINETDIFIDTIGLDKIVLKKRGHIFLEIDGD